MVPRTDLVLFAHVATRPEPELDLAEAVLLVAAAEQPELDVARYLAMLDDLGERAREVLAAPPPRAPGDTGLARVLRLLYGDLGFHGNGDDYYDPRNSFLDHVLERRTGIPITLAIVLIEVCRRAGIDARGVSFPGHFLVRVEGAPPALVDPFAGRVLEAQELRALHQRAPGAARAPAPRLLEPAPKRAVLLRVLHNLRGIYASRDDRERLRAILERIEVLAPSAELRAEIAALGGSPAFVPPRRGTVN